MYYICIHKTYICITYKNKEKKKPITITKDKPHSLPVLFK